MVRRKHAVGPCIALVAALHGCAQQAPPPVDQPPEGAVHAGDDLWMVPAGKVAGCPAYVAWRKDGAVNQAIRFRSRKAGFTMYRDEAACSSPRPAAEP